MNVDAVATVILNPVAPIPWTPIVGFSLAIMVLEFFDISLPRGDTLGVSGALGSAAIVLLPSPLAAILAGLAGTLLAFAARRSTERHTHPAIEMPSLAMAFATSIAIHVLVPVREVGSAPYYLQALSIGVTYLATELITVQFLLSRNTSRSMVRLVRGNVVRQAPLLAAQLSASFLAVIIYPYMSVWGLALVVVLLLLIRQSYAMLLEIRETYRTTLEVLVEAAETPIRTRHGHSERTAGIAREIGSGCGLSPTDLERVSYVALLHDIDALCWEDRGRKGARSPSELLAGVRSFEDVARILSLYEGRDLERPAGDSELLSAYVVALATDIDAGVRPELKLLHGSPCVERLCDRVPRETKARAVAAALRLGYSVPAVS